MKNITKFFLTIAAFGFLAVACQPEPEVHEPGEPDLEGCYGVYFPTQEATGSHTLDPTQPTFTDIEVKRTNSKGAITVPYTVSVSEEGIFTVGEIVFEDGQESTNLHIEFPNAEFSVTYSLSVVVEDPQYASRYNAGAISFDYKVMRVELKRFFGKEKGAVDGDPGTLTAYFCESEPVMYYYETAIDGLRYCYLENAVFLGDDENDKNAVTVNYEFYWDTKTNNLFVPHQWAGYAFNDGSGKEIYFGDAADFYNAYYAWGEVAGTESWLEWCPAWMNKNGFFQPFYDGNGGFYLADWWYISVDGAPTGSGYQFGGADADDKFAADLFIAPGFIRVDYSIEAETDFSYDGEVPVYFTTGIDVDKIVYSVADGELTATKSDALAAQIIAGDETIETATITEFELNEATQVNESAISLSFPETGLYTLVAVTFDKDGVAQESTSIVLNYVAAEDTEEYEVIVDCAAEAVPARYEQDPYTSLAFYIVGKDLTEVHYAIIPASKLTNAFVSTLKYDPEGAYTVDEETLAAINGVGGIYDYVDHLSADTEYAVVVWATNGSLDTVIYDTYKTPKLPYQWVSLGTGIYTDDTMSYLYGEDPLTVEVEVFTEKNDPTLIMMKNVGLQIAAAGFDVTAEVMSEYEGIYWRPTEIVLNVADPDNVIWELQDYGVCWNTSEGFLDGVTNMYQGQPFSVGTYKDGVIAYPTVKGMLCTLNGDGYYYANGRGATKLVLPGAAKSAIAAAPANSSVVAKDFSLTSDIAFKNIKLNIERDVQAVSFSAKSIAPKAVEASPRSFEANAKCRKSDIAF